MRNCHEVFAVTTIYRATSDVAIKDIVSRCGNHRPLRIVCTRSEVTTLTNIKSCWLNVNRMLTPEKLKDQAIVKKLSRFER